MPVIVRILMFFLVLCLAGSGTEARAEKKVKVIASFSILGDMVKNVGGDRVEPPPWWVPTAMPTCMSRRRRLPKP